ncbi:hypothetical protein CEP54_006821 [Fusarium duplospermum]|uniref:Uncharacterized protein n=1 Tax=Fusarium duplospermum TaxID=1325734 RepID=A0A428Q4W5_9HYPO|nr:hypothetical protein CEP54_006821 [Fusarium duplospermum]
MALKPSMGRLISLLSGASLGLFHGRGVGEDLVFEYQVSGGIQRLGYRSDWGTFVLDKWLCNIQDLTSGELYEFDVHRPMLCQECMWRWAGISIPRVQEQRLVLNWVSHFL